MVDDESYFRSRTRYPLMYIPRRSRLRIKRRVTLMAEWLLCPSKHELAAADDDQLFVPFEDYANKHFNDIIAFGAKINEMMYKILFDERTNRPFVNAVAREEYMQLIRVNVCREYAARLRDGSKEFWCYEYDARTTALERRTANVDEYAAKIMSNLKPFVTDSLDGRCAVHEILDMHAPSGCSRHHIIGEKVLRIVENISRACMNRGYLECKDDVYLMAALLIKDRNEMKQMIACELRRRLGVVYDVCTQKTVTVYWPTSNPPDMREYLDESYYVDVGNSLVTWSRGNIFIGPASAKRGPFDPASRGWDFEYNSEPLLGEEKFDRFRRLYELIKTFLEAHDLYPNKKRKVDWEKFEFSVDIWRQVQQVQLEMDMVFNRYSLTDEVPNAWGERRLTEAEKKKLGPKNPFVVKDELYAYILNSEEDPTFHSSSSTTSAASS